MTSSQAIEYRIAQQLLHKRPAPTRRESNRLADRVIGVVALTAGMLLLGSYMPEVLGAVLAAAAVIAMGAGSKK